MIEVKQSLFQYKVKAFFKEIILDGPLGKKYYATQIEFQKKLPYISNNLYGSSMHQIFK